MAILLTATKQWVNNILTNDFAKTLEEAKASPNIVGGQVKGFSITNITPNSVLCKVRLAGWRYCLSNKWY